jgi:hypothetical protein
MNMALAGGQFAALVLRLDARLTVARTCAPTAFFEFFEDIFHGRPCPDLPAQNP